MKKKDLIFYAGTAVLLAFSTQQVKADEQGASDQTSENTSAVVLKTTRESEAQNIATDGVKTDQAVQTEKPVVTTPNPRSASSNNQFAEYVTEEKIETALPASSVVANHTSNIDSARETETLNNSLPVEEVKRLSGTLSIENNNPVSGTFDAVVRDIVAPTGLKEVLVPSWSLENGQDDLIWHKATKQTDGSYRVTIKASEHKGNKGNYRADAYIVDNSNNRHYIAEKVVAVDYARPSGVLTIENNNTAAGTFDAVVRNIVAPTGLKEVLVPSWSLAGGQDDLIWHKATRQADGSYRVTIKATDHKNSTGKYRADAYLIDESNNRFYLTEKVVEVRQLKPSGTLSIEHNHDSTTFDAVIRNVVAPNGLKEVLVPTWSNKNGQDDLIWHKAVRQSDGSYRATIKTSDHKNDDGKYNVHVYYVDQNNQKAYITKTTTEVREVKPSGTVTIENNNTVTGTFDAVIRNVVAPTGLKEVLIPTWSDSNGPDDLVWHKAVRQSDGSYRATIKASDHKNEDGKYNVHVYYVDQTNQRNYITETTTEVRQARRSGTILIQNNNKDTGTFDV
ncbi:GBS Bsp-like repeat-containing protein, partial [Streptococcus sp. HMSC061E03]